MQCCCQAEAGWGDAGLDVIVSFSLSRKYADSYLEAIQPIYAQILCLDRRLKAPQTLHWPNPGNLSVPL